MNRSTAALPAILLSLAFLLPGLVCAAEPLLAPGTTGT